MPFEPRALKAALKALRMDTERIGYPVLDALLRTLTGSVTVVGQPQDLFAAGLSKLPAHWQSVTQDIGWWSAIDPAAEACVWVVGADRFDGTLWAQAVGAFDALSARDLVLVVLDLPGPGAPLRNALETLAFTAGYRKHVGYYQMLDYESLAQDRGPLIVPLEKIPGPARQRYPLAALKEERDLHMDMLRESGERSDAHVIRYHLAASLVKPGDRVLDAACGLGYGSYLLARLTGCASVTGVDGSEYAVDYAQHNFGVLDPRLSFRHGWLPGDLAALPDESFDLIISFETLEHIDNPTGLLAEFHRLLRPGGRIIVSVPNDWSDETGQDPNPHHLHVYTLDTLRQQFSRHFVREHLYQQIASGCKRRATGLQWAPLPRTLREISVDTSMAPDSEWWVMSGSKPERRPQVDWSDPWYVGVQPPWAQTAGSEHLANGLVLAMHCVPATVDPAVEAFWSQLNRALIERGHTLVLLSTTPVADPSLHVIEIPFELTGFASHFDTVASEGESVREQAVHDVVMWYGCDHDTARDNLRLAQAFLRDLLDTMRPAAVLGWQGLNPLTRLLRDCVRSAELPWWTAERGWLRNTLMFDLGGAHLLSELEAGLTARRARARYQASPAVREALRQRTSQAASLARYTGVERISGDALRKRLGIPASAKVAVLFTHGEPGMNSMGTAAVRELHDLSSQQLQARLDDLGRALAARGHWLLVQEHPFNVSSGRCLRLPVGHHVLSVSEDVSSLMDAADVCLFTLATLQFDAVFLEKPLGLLSRSALYRDAVPPFIGDFESTDAFLDALLDEAAWPDRFERLRTDVAFMYEQFLVDIEPGFIADGAEEWADHLARLRRPVDAGFDQRVQRFLQLWSAHADRMPSVVDAPNPARVPDEVVVPQCVLDLLQQLELPDEAWHFVTVDGAAVHQSRSLCVIVQHDERHAGLKKQYEALCNVDADGLHVWVGVRSVSTVLKQHDAPVVVSFYTKGTPYEDQARGLIESIEQLGDVPYCVVGIDSAGSWEANCSLKPGFILQCLQELRRPVLWVDADARLSSRPCIPAGFDFALHRYDGWEFASGTVYFAYNDRSLALLQRWTDLCRERPLIWDQMLLDQAWAGQVHEHPLVTGWLPESYTHIFDSSADGADRESPVITHYQASRSVATKRPKPQVPVAVMNSRRQACAWHHIYDVPSQRVTTPEGRPVDVWPGVQTDLGRLMDYLHALRCEAGGRISFVQVGAMDGVKFDPLHKRIRSQGWRGILFEPLPDMFENLRRNYEGCEGLTFIQAAIDACEGQREMYRIPQSAVNSGQLPDWALGISSFYNDRNALGGKKIDEATRERVQAHTVREAVRCTTFDHVLTEHGIDTLDLLQIDTEGHDWAILQTFPIDRIKPLVINFEYYNLQEAEVRSSLEWLRRHGYAYGMDHKDVTATLLRLP